MANRAITFVLISIWLCSSSFVTADDEVPGRIMPMLGGYQVAGAENDADIQKAATFAADKISEKTNSKLALSKVVSAARQVVAGTNYNIKFEATDDAGAKHTYTAVVFESLPYAGSNLELTTFEKVDECSSAGSNTEQAAEFAAQRISQSSNSLVPLQLKEVLESSVEGSKYNLKLKLGREGLNDQTWMVVVEEGNENQFAVRSLNQI